MPWLLAMTWLLMCLFGTPSAAAAAAADDDDEYVTVMAVEELSSCDYLLRHSEQRVTFVGGQLTVRGTIDCGHTLRQGKEYPLVKGHGMIEFQVDAFNLVEGNTAGPMQLSTNGVISYTPDGIFVAASPASAAAEEAGPKADAPSGSTSDDVDATMLPTVPGPADATDDGGDGNGGEGNVHYRTCTDASPSSGCGSDSGSGSGKDRRDEPGDNHSSSGGGEDGGKKDDTDDHDDHHDYHDLFPGFMQPHSGTSLKVGEKLTGALLSPSRESAIYVDRETGIVVHSNLYLTAFGIWALPVPVPLLKPNSRKFNKTMQMWEEIEEEGLEEDKSGGAKNIPKEGGVGFWPWGKGGSRDRRAKEDIKKHAGEVDIEISDKGVLVIGRTADDEGDSGNAGGSPALHLGLCTINKLLINGTCLPEAEESFKGFDMVEVAAATSDVVGLDDKDKRSTVLEVLEGRSRGTELTEDFGDDNGGGRRAGSEDSKDTSSDNSDAEGGESEKSETQETTTRTR
eukprot:g10411.t1